MFKLFLLILLAGVRVRCLAHVDENTLAFASLGTTGQKPLFSVFGRGSMKMKMNQERFRAKWQDQ
jgi:hypothetical protein